MSFPTKPAVLKVNILCEFLYLKFHHEQNVSRLNNDLLVCMLFTPYSLLHRPRGVTETLGGTQTTVRHRQLSGGAPVVTATGPHQPNTTG